MMILFPARFERHVREAGEIAIRLHLSALFRHSTKQFHTTKHSWWADDNQYAKTLNHFKCTHTHVCTHTRDTHSLARTHARTYTLRHSYSKIDVQKPSALCVWCALFFFMFTTFFSGALGKPVYGSKCGLQLSGATTFLMTSARVCLRQHLTPPFDHAGQPTLCVCVR